MIFQAMISGICLFRVKARCQELTTKAPLQGHAKGMKLNIVIATLLKMPFNAQGSLKKFPLKKDNQKNT